MPVVFRDGGLVEMTDGEFGIVFTPPPAAPKRYNWLGFMDLFTPDEQFAIAQAAMTVTTIKLWYDKALGASFIALDDPRTVEGVNSLVPAGLLTSGRAAAVLRGEAP